MPVNRDSYIFYSIAVSLTGTVAAYCFAYFKSINVMHVWCETNVLLLRIFLFISIAFTCFGACGKLSTTPNHLVNGLFF